MRHLFTKFYKFFITQHPRYRFVKRLPKSARLLEIGCGGGESLQKYIAIRSDIRYAAIDMYDYSKALPQNVLFKKLDITLNSLPFEDSSFDAVAINQVIEHISDVKHVMKEIYRVLSPGGRLYVEVPNWITILLPTFPLSLEKGGTLNFYDDYTHIRPYTKTSLFFSLKHHDFDSTNIKIKTAVNPYLRILSPFLIIVGLVSFNRRFFHVGVMNFFPWAIYAEVKK